MIKAPALSYGAVMTALERGEFYASMGPEIYSLYVEDLRLHVECSGVRSIHMTTAGRRAAVARAETGKTLTSASFEIDPTDGYVRLQLTDREGLRANTNACFVDTLPQR